MILFVFVLLFFGISMAMMGIGYVLTARPLERGCGRLALGQGSCDCRRESAMRESCRYRRKPRSKES
jgi:hypothetical protein